jgi:hypothetical protein
MVTVNVELINGQEVIDFFTNLPVQIDAQRGTLFRSLGDALVNDVKDRIRTSNNGAWAPASKWLKAKTGQSKVLLGAEKYVRAQITKDSLKIVGKSSKWTLTQHHLGFENKLLDPSEPIDSHGRVVIKIKDPRVLNLYVEMRRKRDGTTVPRATVFAFAPKKPGRTPARQIWPTEMRANVIANPIASRWFAKVIQDAGGKVL